MARVHPQVGESFFRYLEFMPRYLGSIYRYLQSISMYIESNSRYIHYTAPLWVPKVHLQIPLDTKRLATLR